MESQDSALYSEVEAASQLHLGYRIHTSEAEPFYGTADPHELVEIINADIHQLFANGTATLYRLINVPDSVIHNLRAGMTLGPLDTTKPASWTTKWEDIEPSALHIYSVHDEIDNLFVIEAEVPLSAVDIPLTIAQNIALHWESEITLLRGHPIKLLSIHRARSYGEIGEAIRGDLNGKMMAS